MKYEGLASFPHILIEADVLFHCYGIAYEAAKEPVSVSAVVPEPEPVVVPEPALLTLEEMTAKLIAENSKAVLVTKAEQAGIETSGTKTELAARLASHLIGV